ncbi:collagen-like triple helix repeat-containing protein, partial [Ralstonia pseudosolanacearum]
MTIRDSLLTASSRKRVAATVLAMLALAGRASGGNPNSGDAPASTANNDPGAVPVGNVASNVVTQTGKTVSDLGTQLGTAQVPLIGGTAEQKDLGATVTSAGSTVQTLGAGISSGLGKIGSTPDPVGTTVQSTGNVVTATGVTVDNAGQTVTDLGAAGSPLAPLNPVTAPAGSTVSALGQGLQGAGGLVTIATSSGPVQQVTQQTSNAVVPLASQTARGTQQVGSTTMLGGPLA